jgi:predicted PhzF superfamily epimerase YddE/YHI9
MDVLRYTAFTTDPSGGNSAGVVLDAAGADDAVMGAAAAAFGGYLRELALITPPTTFTIHQGADMGRPSTFTVTVPPPRTTGITVRGSAVPLQR